MLGRFPRRVGAGSRFNDAGMPRRPAEHTVCLIGRDEFVLIEPGADVVAFLGTFEPNIALKTRGGQTCAHDLDTLGAMGVGEMEDLPFNAFFRFDRETIRFGKIVDVNPRPASFRISPKDGIPCGRHREQVGAYAVVTVVPNMKPGRNTVTPTLSRAKASRSR